MNKVWILLVGKEDWREKYSIPSNIVLDYVTELTEECTTLYDIVILDKDISFKEKKSVLRCSRTYCLFVTENVRMLNNTKEIYACRKGQLLETKDAEDFLVNQAGNYFSYSYGIKMEPEYLAVNQLYKGNVHINGKYCMNLEGNFGNDYTQVLYWKNNMDFAEGKCIDLYLEYSVTGEVDIVLKAILIDDSVEANIIASWEFDAGQFNSATTIKNIYKAGKLCLSIMAKGEGSLSIFSLHNRESRAQVGFFLPGGQRIQTKSGEEIFYYFDPGDMKPPFNVFFADYKKTEGFMDYYMFKELGGPSLLFVDPRLEGGAFYIGDAEYEKAILNVITECMNTLGVRADSVFMSGIGMGAFGAIYYSSIIRPNHIIMAKPILNIGSMAMNEKTIRPGEFPISLDVIMKNYGQLSENSVEQMNAHFWNKFDKTKWDRTKFAVLHMYEDEFDPRAYEDLILHLRKTDSEIFGKGMHGRHDDNNREVYSWFSGQLRRMQKEFGKGL